MAAEDTGTYLEWAKFIAELAKSRQKPSSYQAPMSPEQKDIFNFASERMKSLPNTATDLYPTAQWNATHAPTIDIGRLKQGYVGYRPPQMAPKELAGTIKANTTKPDTGAKLADYRARHPDVSGSTPTQGEEGLFRNHRGPYNDIGGTSPFGDENGIPGPRMPLKDDIGTNGTIPHDTGNVMPNGMTRGDISELGRALASQGVKNAMGVAMAYFRGGLVGAGLAIAKLVWQGIQAHRARNQPAAPPPTGAQGPPPTGPGVPPKGTM